MAADNPGNRSKTGKFNKGVSGNPNGRPKTPQEFKDIVKANTVDAIKKVIYLMNNAEKEDIQLKAAETILDRAYGKAAQPIVGDNDFDALRIDINDPAAVEARINELITKRAGGT